MSSITSISMLTLLHQIELEVFFSGGGGGGGGERMGVGDVVEEGSEHNVQMFKTALLLFKEYKYAKLFRNACLNTEEMDQTSSIYDHFII